MILKEIVSTYRIGDLRGSELRSELNRNNSLTRKERQEALRRIKDLHSGLKFLGKVKAERNGGFSNRIPDEKSWRSLVLLSPKDQARWYLERCPEIGTPEYNMFKRLCKAFGVGGNEFYYWIRKLS